LTTISRIGEKLRNPEYRKAFVVSQINVGIPFQLRALMKARGWTQEQLAEKTGMLQPRISGLMKPGKTRPNIETLRRVAEAFDCGLLVRFAPFSELARWSEHFDPESFSVPSFADDVGFVEHRPQGSAAAFQKTQQQSLEDVQRSPRNDLVVKSVRGRQAPIEQLQPTRYGCAG
jgi:transcriptional regulator with XRE-family HTH domain